MEDNMVHMVVENDKAEDVSEYKRKMIPYREVSIRHCSKCGRTYIVTDNDMLYYASKYGTVPQKCERCRTSKNDSVRG